MSTNPSGRTVWINGKYVPEHEAGVSIFDSALMYGDIFFEMARSFNRIPFRLREHLDRLYQSAKLFRIPEPRNILVGVSRNYTIELAKKLGIPVREKNFGVYEVIQADEAFYTSTPFPVLPLYENRWHKYRNRALRTGHAARHRRLERKRWG